MPMKKSSGSELVTKGYLDKKLDELEGRISRRVNSQFVDFEEKVGRKIQLLTQWANSTNALIQYLLKWKMRE
jgi:hypothetical protein